ncbi:DUF4249 family protein [Maribellus maritimus]|uniref:DUF4249 family protein n=1 Tax=Maribellus maritimus TaxID=2870838 RepID=UPI001EE9FA97|nr:DUF4249 family protein [Maribellus maritimus]MCG6191425.1 DUF4249 domain-containing protein [Maribellus maritimus]
MKEIELETSGDAQEIVVTGFFTDTLPWNIKIYKTFNLNKNESIDPVTNAQVSITGNNTTIFLQHTGNGIYEADSYPQADVNYNLMVEIEGRADISAQSSVPFKSGFSGISTDLTLRTVVSNYNAYSEMVSAGFTITPPDNSNSLCRVRVLKFDSIAGYKRYYFNENSFDKMFENGIEQQIVSNLKVLDGQIVFGPLWKTLAPIIGETRAFENSGEIEKATFLDQVDYRAPAAFSMETCISPVGVFYQAPYETYTLLGDFSEKKSVDIYTSYFYEGEYWIEFMDLSNEYYKFQKDYSLQISNRGDISGTPVLVYSNIINGVGIFAGYQKQIVRIDNLSTKK